MFFMRILRWLMGWVRLEAEGAFPEKLLNMAAGQEINLWGIWRRDLTLGACCPAKQYKYLRIPARRAGMRMHVTERHGAPFLFHRYRARLGIVAGLAAFILLLQFFSQRVWVVEVRGNEKVSSEEILSVMEEYGVRRGADLSSLDIPVLQLDALKKLPDLAWCTVNLQGSIAYVDVAERVPKPDMTTDGVPSNIKAARDGRIVSMKVYTGQAMVQPGDAVVEGMVLVSGVVESKAGPILRRSQASIFAETQRQFQISVPLKETKLLPSGRVIIRPSFYFFTLLMPLYTDGPIDGEYVESFSSHMLKANGISLPLGFVSHRYELQKLTEIVRTEKQAADLASKELEAKVKSELSDATVKSSHVSGAVVGENYVLTGEYDCLEDICVEEPLTMD